MEPGSSPAASESRPGPGRFPSPEDGLRPVRRGGRRGLGRRDLPRGAAPRRAAVRRPLDVGRAAGCPRALGVDAARRDAQGGRLQAAVLQVAQHGGGGVPAAAPMSGFWLNDSAGMTLPSGNVSLGHLPDMS